MTQPPIVLTAAKDRRGLDMEARLKTRHRERQKCQKNRGMGLGEPLMFLSSECHFALGTSASLACPPRPHCSAALTSFFSSSAALLCLAAAAAAAVVRLAWCSSGGS